MYGKHVDKNQEITINIKFKATFGYVNVRNINFKTIDFKHIRISNFYGFQSPHLEGKKIKKI